MRVRYVHERPGLCTGNILWIGQWPMRRGKFPTDHPVGGADGPDCQFGTGKPIEDFRDRGYWASCFPEGDGITMRCEREQTPDQVRQDIAECFGWEVTSRVMVPFSSSARCYGDR